MKKFLLGIFCVGGLLTTQSVNAQTFTPQYDTVSAFYSGTGMQTIMNKIAVSGPTDSLRIKWNVSSFDFPADWYSSADFGFCDNVNCFNMGLIWNGSMGIPHTSGYFKGSNPNGNFTLDINLNSSTTTGTYYFTVHLENTGDPSNTHDITYKITRYSTGVNNLNRNEDIVLYPNPARDELNVTYTAQSGVATISVYNLIGKVVRVFKPTNNSGAQLNIADMPSGIYFVRLQDAQGAVISTKKFTRE